MSRLLEYYNTERRRRRDWMPRRMVLAVAVLLTGLLVQSNCAGAIATDGQSSFGSDGTNEENLRIRKRQPLDRSLTDDSPPRGTVDAVYDLIDRVLKDPNAKNAFWLRIVDTNEKNSGRNRGQTSDRDTDGNQWFRLEELRQERKADAKEHRLSHPTNIQSTGSSNTGGSDGAEWDTIIAITATSASELTAGLGHYFKNYCNFTLEWSTGGRAGGSHIVIPEVWPVPLELEPPMVVKHRTTRWNYLMNVCTHSYSLVWYDWPAWQDLIDSLALRGINMVLALTGQEEIQYRVFSKLGLRDQDIRSWFNGPAFLTWSRGQNEYGSGIAGPLPRSFMKSQWSLQRHSILPRLRSLGMVGILPAFQGNVPVQLKAIFNDSNITEQDDTGWIDALDPVYGKIADLWMTQLIDDFGTDHYYQLDGWFNGGVPPWTTPTNNNTALQVMKQNATAVKRRGLVEQGTSHSTTSAVSNIPHDETWYRRGQAVYAGLSRTDPGAHWMYQGFAFVGWESDQEASYVKGFVDSAPHGKFIVIDMGYSPDGEWQKWGNASFFGAPFIWTKLHNFGDTIGMRGDMQHLSWAVPYQALDAHSSILGIGATPEGIDQNPLYYDFLYDQNFRSEAVQNLTEHLVDLNHKRYGLHRYDNNVTHAWINLLESSYSQDFSVQDLTGVAHLNPRPSSSLFEDDRRTPQPILCKMFKAWIHLIHATDTMDVTTDPFLYDLVNVGREVLAQLTIPLALNFSDARSKESMDSEELSQTGKSYINLLLDLDRLVGTNVAFLLDPWLESARRLARDDAAGGTQHDCFSSILSNESDPGCCSRFYEFNARTQITTWNPTPPDADEVPGGPIDYASKHWSGLIKGYYAERAKLLLAQALQDQQNGQALNSTAIKRTFATHAYKWTTSVDQDRAVSYVPFSQYADTESGTRNAIDTSREMTQKYSHWFNVCT